MPIPSPSELVGSNVTEQQFKEKLTQFIENAESIEDSENKLDEAKSYTNQEIEALAEATELDTTHKINTAKDSAIEESKQYSDEKLQQLNININALGIVKKPGLAWCIEDAVGKIAIGVNDEGDVDYGSSRARQEHHQFGHVLARDENGYIAAAIDKKGNFIAGNVSINTQNGFAHIIADSYGRAALTVDKKGKVSTLYNASEYKYADWHKADVMMCCSLGQSLSRGRNGLPVKNTTQPYANLTFQSGELRNSTGKDYSGFKPLIAEAIDANYGESPNIWHLNQLVKLQVDKGESLSQWVFLGTAPQAGSTAMDGLNKGSIWYTEFLLQVQSAFNLCQAQGKSFVVSHNTWTQGEQDYANSTTKDAYKFELIKLKNDIAIDTMLITGQKFRPYLIVYQTPTHRNYVGNRNYNSIAQAQFEAAIEDDEIIMACPIYQVPFHTDNIHLNGDGYQMLGRYYAKVADHVLVQKKKWRPLQPLVVNWQNRIIDVVFHVPEGELIIDTAFVAEAANYGFDIWSSTNTNTMYDIITSVSITDKNRIKIILGDDAPADAVLSYARGRSSNRPRGNVRDTAGDNDIYENTSGVDIRLDNWCVMFNVSKDFLGEK